MTNTSPVLSLHYGWRDTRRYAIKFVQAYGHERIDIYRCHSIRDLLASMLKRVADLDPGALSRLEAIDERELTKRPHRKRRYFAKHRNLLYPDAPHLELNSVEVAGYWLMTNIGATEAKAIAKEIAEAAGATLSDLSKIAA